MREHPLPPYSAFFRLDPYHTPLTHISNLRPSTNPVYLQPSIAGRAVLYENAIISRDNQ